MKIRVVVHPNSKNPRVEKDLLDTTHIYVKEPALEGKANKAVIALLSDVYKVPKSSIRIVSGLKAKVKLFDIASSKQ